MPRLGLLLTTFLFLAPLARAEVRCAAVFGDHMVLQRERPVAVWGEAAPNEAVTVDFGGQKVAGTADAQGRWQVQLAAMPASKESRTLTVRGTNVITLTDVLVGEVWLCSGQSNMEKQIGPRKGQKPTDQHETEIANAGEPLLRLYQVPQGGKPRNGVLGFTWVASSPESVVSTEFSAAGYFFGRELVRELGVPVGLINASFGGTQIEAWIPESAFTKYDELRGVRDVKYHAWVKGVQATELYQSMIVPLVPFTLRGFLWYQGESNLMQSEGAIYTTKMRALIDGWRTAWAMPEAPWYYVQIAPFEYSNWTSFPRWQTSDALPLFWEAQAAALSIPHTGMVVTTDIVGNVHDIHPTNKKDVGLRLARLALTETYHRPGPLARSPRYAGLERGADGRIELRFTDAGEGLKTRDGKEPSDFQIAGADQRFVPATAEISGTFVYVSSPEVETPLAVRFAWHETATPNLINSSGLPAIPFRTDTWPVVNDRPKEEARGERGEARGEKAGQTH